MIAGNELCATSCGIFHAVIFGFALMATKAGLSAVHCDSAMLMGTTRHWLRSTRVVSSILDKITTQHTEGVLWNSNNNWPFDAEIGEGYFPWVRRSCLALAMGFLLALDTTGGVGCRRLPFATAQFLHYPVVNIEFAKLTPGMDLRHAQRRNDLQCKMVKKYILQ